MVNCFLPRFLVGSGCFATGVLLVLVGVDVQRSENVDGAIRFDQHMRIGIINVQSV